MRYLTVGQALTSGTVWEYVILRQPSHGNRSLSQSWPHTNTVMTTQQYFRDPMCKAYIITMSCVDDQMYAVCSSSSRQQADLSLLCP